MIISLREMTYEELKKQLSIDDNVVIWSCDECIKHCELGGTEKLEELRELLIHDGFHVQKELISRSCFLNLVRHRQKTLADASTIIVLACDLGYECVKNTFPSKKIVKPMKTVGVGNLTAMRGPVVTTPLPWTHLKPSVKGYSMKNVAEELELYPTFFPATNPGELVSITVDGQPYQVKKGANVLDTLQALRIRVPHLCYDPSLGAIGACRLCLVKIKGRLFPSCCTEVSDNMEITVNDDDLENYRKQLLGFIIAENGIDIIEKSVELRYWCRKYRIDGSRYELKPREWEVDDSSEVMVRDHHSCILCGRCVEACSKLAGQHILDIAYRGSEARTISGLNEPISHTACAACMACANYCPTGAITPKLIIKKILINQKSDAKIVPVRAYIQ
jgi:ferredoxin